MPYLHPYRCNILYFLNHKTTFHQKVKNHEKDIEVRPGFEPGTFCVLSRCDNHYTTKPLQNCMLLD